MPQYGDNTLKNYLDDLSARLPIPGGGSAAALTAALGAALVSMVVNFTIGRTEYSRYEADLKVIREKSEKLRLEFLRLVDLDCLAYQSKNIRDALNVPFMTARLCYEGILLCPELAKKGNKKLISDVGVAAVMFEAAFAGSCFNVDINLEAIDDAKLSGVMGKELSHKGKKVKQIRAKTEVVVGDIIRGETGRR